jgi:hypothetical protein
VALSDTANEALKLWQDGCLGHHGDFVAKVEARYKAFEGIIEIASDADKWTSKLAPKFANHIVETSLAGLVDGKFDFMVRPTARFWDEGEYARLADGAEAHEILHRAQLKADLFDEILRPFALQDAIAGLTVAKTYWKREVRPKRRLTLKTTMGMFPRLVEEEDAKHVCFDGPTTEVVDVRDFFWHEAATELQRSPILAHRTWMHYSELEAEQRAGRFSNVAEIKDAGASDEASSREQERESRSRTKDMHEVLEIWWRRPDGIWVCTIGDRKVELRAARSNPFWHGAYPFVACSTRPDLFSIKGMSQVERIAALQEAYWTFSNQQLDNVRFLNNFMLAVNTSIIDDPDFAFGPGERITVGGPVDEAVKSFSPDPISAQVAGPALAKIEQMMQNFAGGAPFTSSSESESFGTGTATEAALVTNLAQRATMAMKTELNHAYARIGQQRTELNQQFLREQIMVDQVGLDNEREVFEIGPLLLQGDFQFDTTPMNEEMMRSQRQASANALMQMAIQLVGPVTLLAQSGSATPLNWDEFVRTWLKAFDDGDVKRFFSAKPPPPPAAQPAGPPGVQQPAAPPGPGGVTGEGSIDPATSPSAQMSLSPEVFMQRLQSMRGGANPGG